MPPTAKCFKFLINNSFGLGLSSLSTLSFGPFGGRWDLFFLRVAVAKLSTTMIVSVLDLEARKAAWYQLVPCIRALEVNLG
mmetsp:Transcript_40539/g.59680  ORF Transcript_40539/g.59680 Transcript_40539/m.59680 type:complete len:81 (-) Transcript_40539:613-855(-)